MKVYRDFLFPSRIALLKYCGSFSLMFIVSESGCKLGVENVPDTRLDLTVGET